MKKTFLSLLITASLLTGCSAVYQSGQTPDDLYYSQGKEISEVRTNEETEEYQQSVSTADDRYLRMKVNNRNQWNSIDDYSYWNDVRYNFSNYGFSHPGFNYALNPWNAGWNSSWGTGINGWNCGIGNNLYGNRLGWSNPMYTLIGYSNPKVIPATYTSGSNLAAYRNRTYNTINNTGGAKGSWGTPTTSGGNNNSFGSLVRKVFATPSNGSNGSNSYERAARTFSTPSNSSSGTSSSAGGSSGGFKSTGSSTSSGRGGRGN